MIWFRAIAAITTAITLAPASESLPLPTRAALAEIASQGTWREVANRLAQQVHAQRLPKSSPAAALARSMNWLGLPEGELAAAYMVHRFPDKADSARALGDRLPEFLTSDRYQAALRKSGDIVFVSDAFFPRQASLAERVPRESLLELLTNERLLAELASTVRPDDYLPGVWQILGELAFDHPQDVREFPGLAVALAVVYDEPLPDHWPHHQVKRSFLPIEKNPWRSLLPGFATAQRQGQLRNDLRRMKAAELKYVIDAPLTASEWAWVRGEIAVPTAMFASAYDLVPYDEARLRGNQLSWGSRPYRLSEIMERGGLCSDQAYFAAMAGKAFGIPTVILVSKAGPNGADPGHAWFAYRPGPEADWATHGGRGRGYTDASAFTFDPQNGQPMPVSKIAR
jgi:hypothetical protein